MGQIPTGNTRPSEAKLYLNVFLITQQEQSFQAGPAQPFHRVSGGGWDTQGGVVPGQGGGSSRGTGLSREHPQEGWHY